MTDYKKINKKAWEKRTQIHFDSEFYDVRGFIAGANTLQDIELNALGDVKGQSLLHLQCHFGMDTLSWARLGAVVTGVDFSEQAINKAKSLAADINVDGCFICADVYEFADQVTEQYDIVFTSYGVLCWLPDIDRWAATVAKSLKPGGRFFMAEFHPVYDLVAGYSYFNQSAPDLVEEGTYTENCSGEASTTATWAHSISDVFNALTKVGIRVTEIKEYPFSPYHCFGDMVERTPGRFAIEYKGHDIPLIYTIEGIKAR